MNQYLKFTCETPFLGEKLRRLRGFYNLTQKDIEQKFGFRPHTISNLETSYNAEVPIDCLFKLSEYFQVPLKFFFDESVLELVIRQEK